MMGTLAVQGLNDKKSMSVKEYTFEPSITREKKNDNCSVKVTSVKKKFIQFNWLLKDSTIILDLIMKLPRNVAHTEGRIIGENLDSYKSADHHQKIRKSSKHL